MTLLMESYILGPLQNRTVLCTDLETKSCIIIDPAYGAEIILEDIRKNDLSLLGIYLTHAHFDHIAGASEIYRQFSGGLPVHLHSKDLVWWNQGGGAAEFGFYIDNSIPIVTDLDSQESVRLGESLLTVRYTPGHTPGHVVFIAPDIHTAVVGDVIFREGVGRTDLPGGDGKTLIQSITTQIMTLPDITILLPGHGPETTVGYERLHNPFF